MDCLSKAIYDETIWTPGITMDSGFVLLLIILIVTEIAEILEVIDWMKKKPRKDN